MTYLPWSAAMQVVAQYLGFEPEHVVAAAREPSCELGWVRSKKDGEGMTDSSNHRLQIMDQPPVRKEVKFVCG
jgi:hypothetical protein